MFNNSKAWSLPLSHRLDSDRILAMLSVSATNLIDVALENPATLLKLDGFQLPPRRSLEQLRAAGYVIKPRAKDPFSREDLDKVQDAMMRFVAFFGCSRVCQHDQAPVCQLRERLVRHSCVQAPTRQNLHAHLPASVSLDKSRDPWKLSPRVPRSVPVAETLLCGWQTSESSTHSNGDPSPKR